MTATTCGASLTYEHRVAPLTYEHRTRLCDLPAKHTDMHSDGRGIWSDAAKTKPGYS